MITNPFLIEYYAPTNLTLLDMGGRDVQAMLDNWQDEAVRHACEGSPRRTFYVEHMAERARNGFPQ